MENRPDFVKQFLDDELRDEEAFARGRQIYKFNAEVLAVIAAILVTIFAGGFVLPIG